MINQSCLALIVLFGLLSCQLAVRAEKGVELAVSGTSDEVSQLEAKYKSLDDEIYAFEGEQMEPEKMLAKLEEILSVLKHLPETEERLIDIDSTVALVKLGKQDKSECYDDAFDWYDAILRNELQLPKMHVNVTPYINHFAAKLGKICKIDWEPEAVFHDASDREFDSIYDTDDDEDYFYDAQDVSEFDSESEPESESELVEEPED